MLAANHRNLKMDESANLLAASSSIAAAREAASSPASPDALAPPPDATPHWLTALSRPGPAITMLAAFGAMLFILNLGSYPLYSKGEPREAVTVLDIVHGGLARWILPMRAGVELPSKPPLMHWLAAVVSILFGRVNEWTVRLPSAILAIGGLLVCYLYVRRLFNEVSGLIAALVLGTTYQYLQAASGARVDITLTFFMEVALFEFIAMAEGLTSRRMLLYLSLAAAILAKGPVGFVIPVAVVLIWIALERRWPLIRDIDLGRGAAIVAVLAGGWYVTAWAIGGRAFFDKYILAENVFTFLNDPRLSGGHAHPFYYVELALMGGFMPWTPMLAGPVVRFIREPHRSNPRIRYLAIWFATVLLFYNFAHSKRGVYLLALYPALAAAIGVFVAEVISRARMPGWILAASKAAGTALLFSGAAALLAMVVAWSSPGAFGHILGWFGIRTAGLAPTLADTLSHRALPAILAAGAAAGLGSYLLRSRDTAVKMTFGIAGGFAALALIVKLIVEPAVANTLSLKQFTIDSMRIVGERPVGYLGALNYDIAFYSTRAIPIVSALDKTLPDYLLTSKTAYEGLPSMRDSYRVALESGPTELDGGGAMVLLKRDRSTSNVDI